MLDFLFYITINILVPLILYLRANSPSRHDEQVEYPVQTSWIACSSGVVSGRNNCFIRMLSFQRNVWYNDEIKISWSYKLNTVWLRWHHWTASCSCPVHTLTIRKWNKICISIRAYSKILTPHARWLKTVATSRSIATCRITSWVKTASRNLWVTSFVFVWWLK